MKTNPAKKILLFYPHNFFEMSSGTHTRVYKLAEYFRDRGFCVDLLSLNGFVTVWDDEALRQGSDFFRNIELCQWRQMPQEVSSQTPRKWYQFWQGKEDAAGLTEDASPERLRDFTLPEMLDQFAHMLAETAYDYVLVSYVFWHRLADLVGEGVTKVIDLHDFITLSHFLAEKKEVFELGVMFEEEVRGISKFDVALSISEEETLMLRPFCPKTRFVNLPIAFEQRFAESASYKYDLLFIGSDNPFNRVGASWFIEEVVPHLPVSIRVAIAGKISQCVSPQANITLLDYVDDLDDLYRESKVVICPLKGGTGLKVKVVEALSYGKPVVTTKWGLTGILQKTSNGCLIADSPAEFALLAQQLLKDQEYYETVRRQGEVFFQQHFGLESFRKSLDSIFLT